MSSSLDDQIRTLLERFRVTLSGQLEAELKASTADIVRAVADERQLALREATERTAAEMRREAEQQLSTVRGEFGRQRDDWERDKERLQRESGVLQQEKESLQRKNENLQREKDGLQQERESFHHEREDIQRGAASEIAGLERALREARDEFETVRRALEDAQHAGDALREQLEESKRDYENGSREWQDAIERAGRETEQHRVEVVASARELERVRARLAKTLRLTSALRTFDEATSLGDILHHLARLACQECGRTAVFLVNGTKLRGWRALGFDDGEPIVGSEFDPAETGVVGQAVQSGIGQQDRNGDRGHLPPFAASGGPRDAIALPVQVGGSVIAVLYADAATADSPEDLEWLDTIEAMTRHAARVLEAMTVRQAAARWTPRRGTGG